VGFPRESMISLACTWVISVMIASTVMYLACIYNRQGEKNKPISCSSEE